MVAYSSLALHGIVYYVVIIFAQQVNLKVNSRLNVGLVFRPTAKLYRLENYFIFIFDNKNEEKKIDKFLYSFFYLLLKNNFFLTKIKRKKK